MFAFPPFPTSPLCVVRLSHRMSSRDRIFVIVAALAVAALIAGLLLQGSDCL